MKRLLPALVLPLALAACGGGDEADGPELSSEATAAQDDPVGSMRAATAEILARPDEPIGMVEVQHILIAVDGAPRLDPAQTQPLAEAEALAADLRARLLAGEEFDPLVAAHSDDTSATGIYLMAMDGTDGAMPRAMMAKAFGDVSWRLKVGEIGVTPYDPQDSPFGFHVILRIR